MGPIETAILTGGGALVAAPLAKDLLGKLLGPSAELLGDKLRENLIAVLGKAETMAQESGVELKQIPARTGVPILEAARLEDDEWMRERWATLLFNAANPKSHLTVRPAYVEILKQLSPQDAKFLLKFYTTPRELVFVSYRSVSDLYEHDPEERQIVPEFEIVCHNLVRLNLLWLERNDDASKGYQFGVTPLGHAFLFACGAFDREIARSKAATPTD